MDEIIKRIESRKGYIETTIEEKPMSARMMMVGQVDGLDQALKIIRESQTRVKPSSKVTMLPTDHAKVEYLGTERICEADGKRCLFHRWVYEAYPVGPGIAVGNHEGGQVTRVYGLVELEDGSIIYVKPEKIKFKDNRTVNLWEVHK